MSRGKDIMAQNRFSREYAVTFNFNQEISFKVTADQLSTSRYNYVKCVCDIYMYYIGPSQIFWSRQGFFKDLFFLLTIDQNTWLKVPAHISSKSRLWVKYEPDLTVTSDRHTDI